MVKKTRKLIRTKIQKGGGINPLVTLRRKLVQRESNLKILEETPLPKSFGRHMAKVRQEEREAQVKSIQNEIQNLKVRINTLDPPKGRFVNINTLYKSPKKEVNALPVKYYIFVNSPSIGGANPFGNSGPQYSSFDRKIMEQILILRGEAFPEDYGYESEGLKEKMISLFGEEVSPLANAANLIWIEPYHCKADPDSLAERNVVHSLITVPPVEKNARFYATNMRVPLLISSCSIIKCKVDNLDVMELYGLATFAAYQKQGFGKDLLLRVLQGLSTLTKPTDVRLLENKYVWLFYKKEKEHLKRLYEGVGFVPINERSENPVHKQLYISTEFLLENARNAKYERYKENIKEKNQYNIIVVEEDKLPEYLAEEKIRIKKLLKERLESSRNFRLRPYLFFFSSEEIDELDVNKFFEDPVYMAEVEENYYQAWYKYMTKRTKFLVVVTEEEKRKVMTLTDKEIEEATEFIREEQQMVLCLADWVRSKLE